MIIFHNLPFLGNNIIQLSNIIDIAIAYKHNVKIIVKKFGGDKYYSPGWHELFDLSVIEKYFDKYNNLHSNNSSITEYTPLHKFHVSSSDEIIEDLYHFFYANRLPYPKYIFEQNTEERNNILQKAFLINNINKLPENDLVIHIRSGDIFSSDPKYPPHGAYIPPPLSYYIKEINKYKYEKIHIICVDTVNPVVNELLHLYNNAVYEKKTLEEDIRMILGATNVIHSVGTFVPSLMLLSNNIKNLHHNPFNSLMKSMPTNFDNKSKDYNMSSIDDYYKIMWPWKNTVEQRNYILTYDYN